jgi:hypothetical protein
MQKLFEILDELEQTCNDEEALRRFNQPDMKDMIAVIQALPPHEQAQLHSQLDRVRTIMECNLLLYGERMEALGGKVRAAQASNAASHSYRRVAAIIPIRPSAHL